MNYNYDEFCTLVYAERLLQLKAQGYSDYQEIANNLTNLFGKVISFTDICNVFEPTLKEEQNDLKTQLKHFNYESR